MKFDFDSELFILDEEDLKDTKAIMNDDTTCVYHALEFIRFVKSAKITAINLCKLKNMGKSLQQRWIERDKSTADDELVFHCENLEYRAYDCLSAYDLLAKYCPDVCGIQSPF
jgi:hypothetical protein